MPCNIFVGNARLSPVRSSFRRIFFPHFPDRIRTRRPIKHIKRIYYLYIMRIIIPIQYYAHRCCSLYRRRSIIEDLSATGTYIMYTILDAAADLGLATLSEHPSSPLAARLPQQQPTTCGCTSCTAAAATATTRFTVSIIVSTIIIIVSLSLGIILSFLYRYGDIPPPEG